MSDLHSKFGRKFNEFYVGQNLITGLGKQFLKVTIIYFLYLP